MAKDLNYEFNRTIADVARFCGEYDEYLGLGLSEDKIFEHNATHTYPEPDRETTRRAVDELVKVGLLEVAVYDGKRTIYRGKHWPDRIAILAEHGWL